MRTLRTSQVASAMARRGCSGDPVLTTPPRVGGFRRVSALLFLACFATIVAGQDKPRATTIKAVDSDIRVVHAPVKAITAVKDAVAAVPIVTKPCLPPLGEITSVMSAIDPLKFDKVAWSEASDEILAVIESIRPLTSTESALLSQLEAGKTDQQKFSGRLNLLKQLIKP